MTDTKKVIRMLNNTLRHCHNLYNHVTSEEQTWLAEINQGAKEALELLKAQEKQKFFVDESGKITPLPEIVRCRDCKHWDKTTREEGNDCISGPWEDAECDMFRDWDRYGDLGEDFRRTNGDWFCANGERG